MANFISEADIERDIIKIFQQPELSYEYLNCFSTDAADLNDKSNRSDKKQVVFLDRLQTALQSSSRCL